MKGSASRWSLAALSAVLIATLLEPGAFAARRQKTVFRSQPIVWEMEFGREDQAPDLEFSPAWTFDGFRAPLAGDPVAVGGLLVAASQEGEITALRATDGAMMWRKELGEALRLGPVTRDGLVFQATMAGALLALDAAQGRTVWYADLRAEPLFPPTPVAEWLLIPTAAEILVAVSIEDGSVGARRPLPGRATAPAEVAEGSILIGTDHGMVVALDGEDFELRWRGYAGNPIIAPPLIHDGLVYVTTADRNVHCLLLKNGKRRWRHRMGAAITARMLVHSRYLYLLCFDNDIYVLRRRNGHLVSRTRLGHRLEQDPVQMPEHLLVVPYTEAALVGLSLPGLRIAGRYALDLPGEWFTTAPVVLEGRVALGYGRSAGRIIALDISIVEDDGKAEVASSAAGPPERGESGTSDPER